VPLPLLLDLCRHECMVYSQCTTDVTIACLSSIVLFHEKFLFVRLLLFRKLTKQGTIAGPHHVPVTLAMGNLSL